MTSEFAFVMRAVGCSARDVAVMDTEAHNLDWGKVFQLAKEQAVPLILTYILRHQKDIPCPEEMRREHSADVCNFT